MTCPGLLNPEKRDERLRHAVTTFLLLLGLGPLIGAIAFYVGLFMIAAPPEPGSALAAQKLPWIDWIAAAALPLIVVVPVGYVIGWAPAAITGVFFVLLYVCAGLGRIGTCLALLGAQALFISLHHKTSLARSFPYNFSNLNEGILVFLTHSIATLIPIYLAWRVYSGRWIPAQQERIPVG